MEGAFVATVLYVFGGLVFVTCVIIVWRAQGYLAVTVGRGCNDDSSAREMFLDLVRDAEKRIVIHDDGDDTVTSLYNDDEVVEAVKRRLQSEHELEVKCLFSRKEDIKMSLLQGDFPRRFQVHYREGPRPDSDIHYKIIDEGKKGYLSVHRVGSTEREYEMIDCTNAKPSIRKRTFRRLIRQFEREVRVNA